MQPEIQRIYRRGISRPQRPGSSLRTLLWTLWTLAVGMTGYLSWHADALAQRPLDLIGLIVHCVVVGVIGLVALTMIEIRLEPWGFLE
jgi:hypothetical protein